MAPACAGIAQLEVRLICNQYVAGSSPVSGSLDIIPEIFSFFEKNILRRENHEILQYQQCRRFFHSSG